MLYRRGIHDVKVVTKDKPWAAIVFFFVSIYKTISTSNFIHNSD